VNDVCTSDNSANACQRTLDFVLWAFSALELPVIAGEDGWYTFTVPEESRDVLGNIERIRFSPDLTPHDRAAAPADHVERYEQLTPDCPLFGWLVERLSEKGPIHASPRSQPERVHELTPHIFDHYTVDGGGVHLAGCRLEDLPFVRLTYRTETKDDDGGQLADVFIAEDGQIADEALIIALGLGDLRTRKHPPQPTRPQYLEQLVSVARTRAITILSDNRGDLMAVAIVWCKYAWIKLAFEIGDETGHREFSGWARMIADGDVKAPPFACPLTSVESYHVTATDDGRITAAEAIAVCEQSGERVLTSDLTTCAATGQQVSPSLMARCPVSGKRVSRTALVECGMCRQQVSPKTVRGGRCSACRHPKSLNKADPRMARVLDEHPGLDSWGRWRISETETVYVLVASALLRRLLVVIDKKSLGPLRVATRSALGSKWSDMPPIPREELLRSNRRG
jgi:hypothetical protein